MKKDDKQPVFNVELSYAEIRLIQRLADDQHSKYPELTMSLRDDLYLKLHHLLIDTLKKGLERT